MLSYVILYISISFLIAYLGSADFDRLKSSIQEVIDNNEYYLFKKCWWLLCCILIEFGCLFIAVMIAVSPIFALVYLCEK